MSRRRILKTPSAKDCSYRKLEKKKKKKKEKEHVGVLKPNLQVSKLRKCITDCDDWCELPFLGEFCVILMSHLQVPRVITNGSSYTFVK